MITNPQAIRFCNENARIVADLISSLDRTCEQFQLNVVRDFESVTGSDQDADVIDDGSAEDGRNPVMKINVAELKFVVEQVRGALAQDDRIALVNKWVVNGLPRF